MTELELKDVFAPFYDELTPESAIQAIERVLDPYKRVPDDSGCTLPIIPLDLLSQEDLATLNRCSAILEEQLLYPQPQPPAQEAAPINATSLSLTPFDSFSFNIARNTLRALTHQKSAQPHSKPSHLELTELLLSRVILRKYNGEFYIYTGLVYQHVPASQLPTLILGSIHDALRLDGNARTLSGIITFLSAYPAIQVTSTTDSSARLYFLNGALEVPQGIFRPIGPHDFFTSHIAVNYPVGEMPSCPIFDGFLSVVSGGDPIILQTIWEMLGYLIVPGNEAKAFFILQGVGNSGKSVLGNLISELFNPEAVSHLDIFRLGGRFDTSVLRRIRINVSMDLPSGTLNRQAISNIKAITGDDGIPLESKFKDVEFGKVSCKLLFGSNHRISLAELDEAFLNRLVVIPFRYAIPKEQQDKHLLDKLRSEKAAIVVHALAAYQELAARNFQFLLGADEVGRSICGYTESGDVMEDFLTECCAFDENAITPTSALYQRFCAFCTAKNLPPLENSNIFSRALNKYCGGRIHRKKARVDGDSSNCYIGIRLVC